MNYKSLTEIKKLNVCGLGFKIYRSQKGVSFMFAIFILAFILSIALGTSTILVRQIKIMREIGYSVVAFYAADSGMEEVLMMATPSSIGETQLNGSGAKYQVDVKDSSDPTCNASNYCIKSIGSYQNTRRAIEVTY